MRASAASRSTSRLQARVSAHAQSPPRTSEATKTMLCGSITSVSLAAAAPRPPDRALLVSRAAESPPRRRRACSAWLGRCSVCAACATCSSACESGPRLGPPRLGLRASDASRGGSAVRGCSAERVGVDALSARAGVATARSAAAAARMASWAAVGCPGCWTASSLARAACSVRSACCRPEALSPAHTHTPWPPLGIRASLRVPRCARALDRSPPVSRLSRRTLRRCVVAPDALAQLGRLAPQSRNPRGCGLLRRSLVVGRAGGGQRPAQRP